ncbi:MAG: hypothetical protein WC373_04595 [Smithella sp.]|jgi:hypothetical protein
MSAEYLGDSVYVNLDENVGLVLTTDNGNGPSNTIYLEYGVWEALQRFAERIGWQKKGNP